MPDLSTSYMGISLKNPILVAACSLSGKIDNIKKLEDNGAGGPFLVLEGHEQRLIALEGQEHGIFNGEAIPVGRPGKVHHTGLDQENAKSQKQAWNIKPPDIPR